MEWTLKPVTDNSLFELFAGDEDAKATQYTPGRALKVSLRTKRYDSQYNGLLLYAIAANDASEDPVKIGRWEFTDTEDRFHSFCPGTVLHGSASLKPYLSSWRFFPPADFSGDIKFIGLIKVGPPNDGSFYYPNEVTVRATGTAPTLVQQWHRGANNRSCDETCRTVHPNLRCDATRIDDIDTPAKFEAQVAPSVSCRRPLLARCTDQGLATDATGFCYYNSAADCTAVGLPSTVRPTCGASGVGTQGRRICPCVCAAGESCAAVSATSSTVRPTTTRTTTTRPVVSPTPTRTTTRNTGTNTNPNPGPTGAPATEAPKPVCKNQRGCQCGDNGECPSGDVCTLTGNLGICTSKTETCNSGDLGCACAAGDKCNDALVCTTFSATVKSCVRPETDMCGEGLLGCKCSAADGCIRGDADCKKQDAVDASFCIMKAAEINNVCKPGAVGCPCAPGKVCNAVDGESGVECKLIGANEICVDMRLFVDLTRPIDVIGSASTAVVSLLAAAAAMALMF
jgi:hypothetical protein